MTVWLVVGWIAFAASCVVASVDHRYWRQLVKQKNNAIDVWREEAKRMSQEIVDGRGDLTNRENANTDLLARLARYKRAQGKNGRFVSAK